MDQQTILEHSQPKLLMKTVNPLPLVQLKRYLTEQEASPRTTEAYVGVVRRVLSGKPWDDPVAMRPLLKLWRNEQTQALLRKQFSKSKVMVEVAAIRRFYEVAVDQNWITESPATELKSVGAEVRLPRPIPLEDLTKLVQAIDVVRDRAIIELFLNGFRNVEVCRMNLGWLTYTEGSLTARVRGKGNHEGDVVLSPSAAHYVSKHILGWLGMEFTDNHLLDLDKWLRTNRELGDLPVFRFHGHRPERYNLNQMFNGYRDKAGLDQAYGPHSLRHTCGTELLERGTDIRVVQDILRHKNLNQTLLYTQVRRGPKEKAMRTLPNFGTTL